MASSLGAVGSASLAAVDRQEQRMEGARSDRQAGAMQQVMSRTTQGSETRSRRQVAAVEASKGQNISLDA